MKLIVVPKVPESLNEWSGRQWYYLARLKKVWLWSLIACGGKPKNPPAERTYVRVVMYRHGLLDQDNLWASCKPLFDALKRCGWVKDDDQKHITSRVEQVKIKGPVRTEIYFDSIPIEEGNDGNVENLSATRWKEKGSIAPHPCGKDAGPDDPKRTQPRRTRVRRDGRNGSKGRQRPQDRKRR